MTNAPFVKPYWKGKLRDLCFDAGGWLERGAKLRTLEAMKIQTNICAPLAGRISKLPVLPGQRVEPKDLVVIIVP